MSQNQQARRQKRELEALTEKFHKEKSALSELSRACRNIDFDIADCQTRIAALQTRLASLLQLKADLPSRVASQTVKTVAAKKAFTLAVVQPQIEKLKRLKAVIEADKSH